MKLLPSTKRPDTNVGDTERVLSMIGGGGLLVYALARRDKMGAGLALLGGTLVYRGVSGHCNLYQALGVNLRDREGKGAGHGVGVPYELGFRVDHTVRIDKSRDEVYRFWRNFENLPRFMANLDSVTVLDEKRSRWTAKAPAGMSVSWEAEIINEVPGELIGWRSLPGSQVDVAGSVQFHDSGAGTELKVELQYNPPAGTLGRVVARWVGEDPAEQIRHDLDNFKQLMETGSITTSVQGNPKKSGPLKTGRGSNKLWNRDEVVKSSEESFPASDAPSWTPEAL